MLSFLIYLLLFSSPLTAQDYPITLQTDFYRIIDRNLVIKGKQKNVHTTFKPYNAAKIAGWLDELDSSSFSDLELKYLARELVTFETKARNYVEPSERKYFFKEDNALFKWKAPVSENEKYSFSANPVLNFNFGLSSSTEPTKKINDTLFLNSRGAEVFGFLGNKVGLYTYFADNQTVVPVYADRKIQKNGAVPGEGQWVLFKNKGYDFYSARGFATFDVFKPYINFQFGHGRHFIGNGFRSVVLSDYATDYPYFKLTTRVGKIQYTNLFAQLTDFIINKDDGAGVYPKKYFALHHLSINLTDRFNIGFFESVVNGLPDSLNGGFEISYLNPLIFYRSAERNLGSPHNGNLGMDLSYDFYHSVQLYAQFLLDDFNFAERKNGKGYWGNKYGLQSGIKYFNFAGVDHLDFQYEWNSAQPYTYSHWLSKGQNYSHFGQELAHPTGANFMENIFALNYCFRSRYTINVRYFYIQQGLDSIGVEWGGNIFGTGNPHQIYENRVLQGIPSTTELLYGVFTWRWNYNVFIDFTFFRRNQIIGDDEFLSTGWMAGLRMNIGRKEYLF
ncbi:MAG: hypothetical protein A3H98_06460 [Bacteroidetes bacterium RIFCSPLOWO2_02_FULL_36_8]|nr:MAG: hypothetical protein A3H98_06460 [Bacteroidetes bacterium RIFCSPLOWO2_02_FULL_36_8]OFY71107.1 MAG: hypothetical protein A3G23_14965 [Bacteroidetes bacterium RIFCSPLOWO2_12_FULL_37_12]